MPRINQGRIDKYVLESKAVDIFKEMYKYSYESVTKKTGETVLRQVLIKAFIQKIKNVSDNDEKKIKFVFDAIRKQVQFWRNEYKQHPLKRNKHADDDKFAAYDMIDSTLDIIEDELFGAANFDEAYNIQGTIQTVKNQLMNTLGSGYSFMGGGMTPKFTVQPDRYKEVEFEIAADNGGMSITPKINGIPDMLDKKKNIAFMRAVHVLADYIKNFKYGKLATAERYNRTAKKLRIEEYDRKSKRH